jgi:hypothetical protein
VESRSALVEHHDGRLELVHWKAPQARHGLEQHAELEHA